MTLPEQIKELPDVDYIGLIFYGPSPRNALRLPANDISFSSSVRRVGVFVDADTDYIRHNIEKYKLSAIQLHGKETPEICRYFKDEPIDVWKAIPVGTISDLEAVKEYEDCVDRFVFDTKTMSKEGVSGGTGETFDWNYLNAYTLTIPFMLAGGIKWDHAGQLRKINHPAYIGIDINSRFETAPGVKDIPLIRKFISQIRL